MLGQITHGLIVLPVLGFFIAVGAGVAIRTRRAREDKRVRDEFVITD
jgi:hypothetical protein